MIYLSEIETRPVPEACHVVSLPIVQRSGALVSNRAMSPVTTLVGIDLLNIIFKRHPGVHTEHGKALWRLEQNNRRTTRVHRRPVAICLRRCQVILSVP